MNTLSRREEETLLKATKGRALKDCDPIVREFAACASGRTVSVAWACSKQNKAMQDCLRQYTGPEAMAIVREEYLRLRNQQQRTEEPPAPS
ncbi:COX assembly mitochondrial protein 2 [Grifola frondosa]|uniref:COX assembly mitochondrial protein n=1 Tax=Grifola frondosa TaxID=5627 RepID=A0A1C7MPK2_GRIFR|nr:COX assembly mitochondrial protein 2 [Grifola frondosa]